MPSSNTYLAVDLETSPVPFFDKAGRSKLSYSGHPRLAKPFLISISDGLVSECRDGPQGFVAPDGVSLVFHNASFDGPLLVRERVLDRSRLILVAQCTRTMAKILKNDAPSGLKDLARDIEHPRSSETSGP